MKLLVNIVRIIVGLLFIFSGLIKANDPLGLSYKMQEYFEIWEIHQFNSWTLLMSVLMNAFEIIAGFALLLGWRIKLFSWLLLLLIVFFTFLTGYTYITGKPTNCGCFGDCLPITSKTSFLKDVVLLVLIGFLFWKQKMIRPFLSPLLTTLKMLGLTVLSFGFQLYTLSYLPVVDCLPYKKGKNITAQMKVPANAIPDSTVITFEYEKDGKPVEFTASQFPSDFNDSLYTFKRRYDKVIRQGKNNLPPIKGFALSGNSGEDSTSVVLSQPYAILLYCEDFSIPVAKWKDDFTELYAAAKSKNIPVYVITGNKDEAIKNFAAMSFTDIQIFTCDNIAIRTAARTNPCVYLLKEGTIIDKQSYRRMHKITTELSNTPVQKAMPSPAEDTIPEQNTGINKPVTGNQ